MEWSKARYPFIVRTGVSVVWEGKKLGVGKSKFISEKADKRTDKPSHKKVKKWNPPQDIKIIDRKSRTTATSTLFGEVIRLHN